MNFFIHTKIREFIEIFVILYCYFLQRIKMCMKYYLLLVIIVALLANSCKTADPCPPNEGTGNVGSNFNSELDEYSPYYFQNSLYFTALLKESKQPEQMYRADFRNGKFEKPVLDSELPMDFYEKSGLPKFYNNKDKKRIEMYFTGMSKSKKMKNSEILYSYKVNNKWIEPLPIVSVNSKDYDSHPAISPDGKTLIFVSDREGGIGGLDLYISKRNEDGSWGTAENMGAELNTPMDEKSPFINENWDLYFASKGYPGPGKYDIIKAKRVDGNWVNARALSFPINTEFNEAGPAIVMNKIFFDSDRRGGCGGKDLYAFELCGPVIMQGIIESEMKGLPVSGKLRLSNEKNEELMLLDIDETGKFDFPLEGGKKFKLQYFNSCYPDYVPEQIFDAECNDSAVVKYFAKFVITGKPKEFDFSEYKVPFFVSGYYMPNTSNNLESLRLKFAYNLLGNDSTTKYIENPNYEYDDYYQTVENALNDASEFIVNIMENLDDDCKKDAMGRLRIKVTGFADPRPISSAARFQDESIDDQEFGLSILKGTLMNNERLSLLRAYFTAKYLKDKINDLEEMDNNVEIVWEIEGKGIDPSDKDNKLKRRVNILIGVEGKE